MKFRRAQYTTLQKLIIGVLVVLLIATVTVLVINAMKKVSAQEICRMSVFGKAQSKRLTAGTAALTNLECYTRYVNVRQQGIFVDSQYGKEFDDFSDDRSRETKRYIAEELRNCWYQMGEGKYDPFGSLEGSIASSPIKDDSHCMICSEIQFVDKTIDMSGLTEIFKEKMQNSALTYNDYLYQGKDAVKIDYDTSKNYGIVWVVVDKAQWINRPLWQKFILNGWGVLLYDKATREAYTFVVIAPLDEVGQYCDRLY